MENAHVNTTQLTKAQICELPFEQRKPFVESIFIDYDLFKSLREQINRAIAESVYSADPKCMLITGGTGAGKTTLLASCMEEHPSYEEDCIVNNYHVKTTIQPAVWATFTQPPQIRNIAACMLRGFKDPFATKGSKLDMEERIQDYVKNKCKTLIMFGDEIQELWNKDHQVAMHEATDWLKYMIKDLGIAVVLAGLEGDAENVINHNPQLKRLFGRPKILHPFKEYRPFLGSNKHRSSVDDDRTKFIQLLCDIEVQLPFREQEASEFHIYSEEIAWRCFAASRGRMGYLMKIIREAAQIALDKEKESINLTHLAQAFDEGGILDIDNPFQNKIPKFPLPVLSSDKTEAKKGKQKGK